MAPTNIILRRRRSNCSSYSHCYCLCLFCLPNLLHLHALQFNFPDFNDTAKVTTLLNISQQAKITQYGILRLTEDSSPESIGRAVYGHKIRVWDSSTGKAADFTTTFEFSISKNASAGGDGFAFFLSGSQVPNNSIGGCLGLVTKCDNTNADGLVAVEFDTFQNHYDTSSNHVGININSIYSIKHLGIRRPLNDGSRIKAVVNYTSLTSNFTVTLSFLKNSSSTYSLWSILDFARVMPEYVTLGFSAATGAQTQKHDILSWEFNSTDLLPAAAPPNKRDNVINVIIGCVVGGTVLVMVLLFASFCYWRRSKLEETPIRFEDSMNQQFDDNNTGPKRYSYSQLARATNNFAEEGLLGEGGFGEVYKGFLSHLKLTIAVKRVSKRSKQGRKEYISEVNIISRLRHKNLVKLLGWCHENGEFLLIYEFMPNGSLDSHLFKHKTTTLEWAVRYKIALGLASALLYLHEESEQSVIHRDIKSSNIMLDSEFNTKLGDFGLARLMDQELGLKTTGLAGTFGYMAPEYISTGKASKASDVYSFGVVALEIACGRRSVDSKFESSIVAWVWETYGNGGVVNDVADKRLCMEFEVKEMEGLISVGLWCAHPDHTLRPSIRQALQVLKFEAALPNLPNKMPPPNFSLAGLEDHTPVCSGAAHSSSYSSINVGR
ncbi:hypothetical protein FNV43_RR21170 [Rhamnella rubrinervis]|uniref:non-specific serine/threonine protein kinase n=1 Tax=Rhamnella rubrinervis TaxID=2594499 RepID=A0A8K0E1T3_9ROSA|nr:hypothetical protein FNV43_RR21170 [Rhamnella rubrinervis]